MNARPTPNVILYIPANIAKTIKNKLPKRVSNKLTKIPGTTNITIHNTTNKVINPTIKFIFIFFCPKKFIIYIIQVKYYSQLKYSEKLLYLIILNNERRIRTQRRK
jgi:hypothetical protein